MTRLSLTLPASPLETPTSYLSRLAARNLIPDLYSFCGDLGFDLPALINGDTTAVQHLCALAGLPQDTFDGRVVVKTSTMKYRVGAEALNTETLSRGEIRYCPRSLSETADGKVKWLEDGDMTVNRIRLVADVIPPALITARFFPDLKAELDQATARADELAREIEELAEEHGAEGGLLESALSDTGKLTAASVKAREKSGEAEAEERALLKKAARLAWAGSQTMRRSSGMDSRSSLIFIGASVKMRASISVISSTSGAKPIWSRMSRCRSIPGAISIRRRPPASSRKTQRSVT